METKEELYEKVMYYAHLLEDRLGYDESKDGRNWGKLVNKLQGFSFVDVKEDKISFTYSFLRRKLDWLEFCELTGTNEWAKNEGAEFRDNDIYYITESKAKQFNLI